MAKIQGGTEPEAEQREGLKIGRGRIERRVDPFLVLAQVVYDLSMIIEERIGPGPSPSRIDLRMGRHRLLEAFPRLRKTDSDLAQALAEQDGHGQDY